MFHLNGVTKAGTPLVYIDVQRALFSEMTATSLSRLLILGEEFCKKINPTTESVSAIVDLEGFRYELFNRQCSDRRLSVSQTALETHP
jgi:hypothetical protein